MRRARSLRQAGAGLVALALLGTLAALPGCATTPGGLPVDTRYRAASQDSRVQFIVLHYTAGPFRASLRLLTEGEVSSHYLVDRDPPTVYRLVDEDRRAWHAGPSSWQGQTPLNASSIGIEIVNAGCRGDGPDDCEAYPEAQLQAVIALVRDIQRRHQVRPDRIVGHAEIQPLHKEDPGPRFPWRRLHDEGLVPWPDEAQVAAARPGFEAALPEVAWFQERLAAQGYDVPRGGELDPLTRRVLRVFQMRYRPARFDGLPDAETAALLDVLTRPDGLLLKDAQGVPHPWRPPA